MLGKMELVCIKKLDTACGLKLEAQLQFDNIQDAKMLVSQIEESKQLNSSEFWGYHIGSVLKVNRQDLSHVISRQLFITFRSLNEDEGEIVAMSGIADEIMRLIS